MIYADTSALAKVLLEEEGSSFMQEAFAGEVFISSAFTYVELSAAVARALRGGRFLAAERDALFATLERVWAELATLVVSGALIRESGRLAERSRLHAGDALQLASLIEAGDADRLRFACWDKNLRRAAADLGYALVPESIAGA